MPSTSSSSSWPELTVDPSERELLAQFLGVAVVGLDVNRTLEEERLIQTIQLILNRLRGAFRPVEFLADGRFSRLPDAKH